MASNKSETGKLMARKVQWALQHFRPHELATACGVKPPSVYTWRDEGRIDKKHLTTLAALTGTRADWWLTLDAPIPPTAEWLADTIHTTPGTAAARGLRAAISDTAPAASLSVRERKLLEAFGGLTDEQQKLALDKLEQQKTDNERILAELGRRSTARK